MAPGYVSSMSGFGINTSSFSVEFPDIVEFFVIPKYSPDFVLLVLILLSLMLFSSSHFPKVIYLFLITVSRFLEILQHKL